METVSELKNFFRRVLKIGRITETSGSVLAHTTELSDAQLFAIGQSIQEHWYIDIKLSGSGSGLVITCKSRK